MDTAVMWLMVAFAVWAVGLVIVLCIQACSTSKKTPEQGESPLGQPPAQRFFADPAPAERTKKVDEETVRRVQRYIEKETNMVERFVSKPSVQTLYDESDVTIGMN